MNRSIATILLSVAVAWPQAGASAAAGPVTPAVPPKARPIPLRDVRLTGGPLKQAQDRNAAYLLSLSPDRMMAFLRKAAGLEPKAAGYGGWDGDDRQLTGHIAGHYLSGVSLMYRRDRRPALQGAGGLPGLGARGPSRTSTATAISGPRPTGPRRRARPFTTRSRRGTSARPGSTSTACGRRGTSSTRSSPACATPIASPATGRPSRSRRASRPGPSASCPSSTTRRSRRCSAPSSAA
ncbi:MAG: glycoside hydrolase family 127 protein [Desulfomicrobium escambiense]|nr:glycoside hydrolase family 127 protein [Desulfomicrobium escambiense]